MSEQTKAALEQFVQKMIAGAEQAGNFAVEQTPLLVQEWLRWQAASAAIWLALGAVILIAGAVSAKKARTAFVAMRERHKDSWWDDDPYILWGVFGGGAPIALGLLITFVNLGSLVKVLVAPRVVVLEQFIQLVK